MRVLILGGAGFIGLHLARRQLASGHEVTIVDDFSRGQRDRDLTEVRRHPNVTVVSADLTDRASWAGIAHESGYDEIYLLAAVVGVRNVEADPSRVVRVNTLAALNLLDWLDERDGRVFFASTSEVYAGGVDAGLVEVPTAEDVPVLIADVGAPRFAYAISKLLGEAAFLHAARSRGVPAIVGRFHNVYGPRMGADHVIPEMLLRAMSGENPFRVWGADQSRAFCYVDDAVEAMVRLMATPEAVGQIVHIGDDTAPTRIADLATLVLEICDEAPAIETQPAPAGSVARRCPDLTRLRALTGYEPKVGLAEGIRRTMIWYREQHQPAQAYQGPARAPIAFYYGEGQIERLAGYRRVVLQPDRYSPDQLAELRQAGTRPLAYLSLSEDTGPAAPWQRAGTNPDWGGHYVHVDHPGWIEHVRDQARTALAAGFVGLFLDTLNLEFTFPDDLPHLLDLVATLRRDNPDSYLLANRGFALLPELTRHVNGVLFESFTTRWTEDGYEPWPADVLETHARIAEDLATHGIDLYALDYADRQGQIDFATRRAEQFGLSSFVSDRALSRL